MYLPYIIILLYIILLFLKEIIFKISFRNKIIKIKSIIDQDKNNYNDLQYWNLTNLDHYIIIDFDNNHYRITNNCPLYEFRQIIINYEYEVQIIGYKFFGYTITNLLFSNIINV